MPVARLGTAMYSFVIGDSVVPRLVVQCWERVLLENIVFEITCVNPIAAVVPRAAALARLQAIAVGVTLAGNYWTQSMVGPDRDGVSEG